MKITGEMLIGRNAVRGCESTLQAINPSQGMALEPTFGGGGSGEVDQACHLAQQAFDSYRETPLEARAQFLEAIGQGILALGDALIERACAETGLPKGR